MDESKVLEDALSVYTVSFMILGFIILVPYSITTDNMIPMMFILAGVLLYFGVKNELISKDDEDEKIV